jgi:hypothetical protein
MVGRHCLYAVLAFLEHGEGIPLPDHFRLQGKHA